MSAVQKRSTSSYPLVAVLLGALAFNLSSWPTSPARDIQSTDLSSECITQGLEEGDSAKCDIHDEVVTGSASAEYEERQVRDRSKEDPKAMKTVGNFKILVCMRPTKPLSDDGAGLIKGNPDCKKETAQTPEEVALKVKQMTIAEKEAIQKRIDLAKAKKERAERCEVDKRGKVISDDSDNQVVDDGKSLECKMKRAAKMKKEDAAEYYETEIQPKLQEMASCSGEHNLEGLGGLRLGGKSFGQFGTLGDDRKCALQRQKAIALTQSLAKLSNRNPYITESLKDLRVFAIYNKETEALMAANQLPANDPRRRMAAQALERLQSNWGFYLNQRGLAVNNMRSPLGWESFSVSDNLSSDLSGYNSDMSASFARVAQLHQQYMAATGQSGNGTQIAGAATPISAGNGRTARGMPSTSYEGGPGNNQLGLNNNRQGLNNSLNNRGLNPQSVSRPLNGSSISKPQMGQRVR